MLVRLVYASRSASPVTDEVIGSILAQSRKNNPEHGLTGVLCLCHSNMFLQVLEGGRDEVNRIYSKVLRDDRHIDVTLLDYSEISERRFSSWRMGRVDMDKVNAGIILKYSEKSRLDPFLLSGSAALTLLEELVISASIASGA